jgi:hypothetical protein
MDKKKVIVLGVFTIVGLVSAAAVAIREAGKEIDLFFTHMANSGYAE